MAEKGFGVKEINLIGASGTPTIESPNNLNLNAVNVAISTNATIGGNLTVSGTVGIAGTLTYEDVTNVDAVGIITARDGINVTGGNITIPDSIIHSGDTDTKIRFSSNDTVSIETGGNEQIRFNHSNLIQLYNHIVPNNNSTKDIGLTGTRFRAAYVDNYYGSGANLTALPAANLTGTLPALDGSSLTGIAVTEAPVTDYTISANGSSAYRIHGGGVDETANSPDLYLIRGQKYRFNNTTGSGHPFAIRVSNGGSAYTDGVSGSNQGVQFFTVPYAAPASLVYQCTIHGGMIGNIYIRGGASTANISNNADNRIITGGSGGNLNGEANLSFNGSLLDASSNAEFVKSGFTYLRIGSTDANGATLTLDGDSNGDGSGTDYCMIAHKTDGDLEITADNPANAANIIFKTNSATERFRIKSDGTITINSTATQPSSTVSGYQFDAGGATVRIASGAGASGTTSSSIALMGSNHNSNIENGANSGAQMNLYNYNTSDGNSSAVSFLNSNGLSASRILGLNVSHSSRTGALVFMTSNGSHPTEKLRIKSDGNLVQSSTTAFQIAKGTTGQRPTGAAGMMRYNSTENKMEFYNGTAWKTLKEAAPPLSLSYLVIGGGGAGGGDFRSGGGGAGAYRTNWNNESQGGGQASGSTKVGTAGIAYSIVVGAGGVGSDSNVGGNGGQSKFDDIISDGGGGGGEYASDSDGGNSSGSTGGSGGGGGGYDSNSGEGGSSGTYGYDGGNGDATGSQQCGGGGGGAASAGVNGSSAGTGGDGGTSLVSTITGSSVARAGGGGAGAYSGGNNAPEGGGGGAGAGVYGAYYAGNDATANTGSGGGGSSGPSQYHIGGGNAGGGDGGSGVVILRYPSQYTATYTSGVTKTSSTVGTDKVDIITATSNSSQTVTFSD